jgi:small subunit ribosomal protein S1
MSDENTGPHVEAGSESTEPQKSDAGGTIEAAVATQAPPSDPQSGPADTSPLGAYRRMRLAPTADPSEYKAVPSIPAQNLEPSTSSSATDGPAATMADPTAAEDIRTEPAEPVEDGKRAEPTQAANAEPEAAPTVAFAAVAAAAPAVSPPVECAPRTQIELPPPVKELDAELEAEIEAAMASGELELAAETTTEAVHDHATLSESISEENLEPGQHLTGRIQSIHADNVFLDLGCRSPGVVSMRQFVSGKKAEVGQRIEVLVDHVSADEGLVHLNLPKGLRRVAGNWESLAKGQVVDCTVNRTNKGGLEVTVSGLRAFLPSSQIDLGFVADLDSYVGQKLRVEVMEVNRKKRNLVVSRRAYLQIERQEAKEKFWQTVEVGQTFTGKVKTIKDYGAFVDLGCVDGFLHVGEMSWHRIKHPSELLKEGQTIDVKVLALDKEKDKIGLGMKQLVQNPWTTAAEKYPPHSTVTGKVTRIADFGAFVELEPGLEGLVHVSEIDHKHVRHVSDVLKAQQFVTAQVLEVDMERKRVSLSLKALIAKPEEKPAQAEPTPESVQRKRKGPLKGGTGRSAPGALFGNPADYA